MSFTSVDVQSCMYGKYCVQTVILFVTAMCMSDWSHIKYDLCLNNRMPVLKLTDEAINVRYPVSAKCWCYCCFSFCAWVFPPLSHLVNHLQTTSGEPRGETGCLRLDISVKVLTTTWPMTSTWDHTYSQLLLKWPQRFPNKENTTFATKQTQNQQSFSILLFIRAF